MTARHSLLPSESQELLLNAALLEGDAALSAWRAWQAVDSVTGTDQDSGRLFPLLCRNLLAIGTNDPDVAILKNAYRHQWLANQLRLEAAGRALRVLSDAGIETMILKGAALAYRHYRDLGARPMYDVDVLVRPDRARAAAEALLDAGWTQCLPTDLDLLLVACWGTAFNDRMDNAVDLHWYAMWSPAIEDDFWLAAEPLEVAGVPTLAQCPADQLLQVCVHGIWSDGMRLRWVPDALAVIRSTPDLDWDRLISGARSRALTLPLHEALRYLRGRFGTAVPASVLKSLDRHHCDVFERATHRAWHAPPTRLRHTWLMIERYRRQRPLPAGATHEANLRRYFRAWASMMLGLQDTVDLTPALVRHLLPGLYAIFQGWLQRQILDRSYGIPEASRNASLAALGYDAPGRRDYAASSWSVLGQILPKHEVGGEDVFVDIGCGMGRVVLSAARYPFKRVIGLDIVPEFADATREAVAKNRHRLRCQQIEVITADAACWDVPDDVTVAYLYDPVYGEVLDAVIGRLLASLDRRPRRLRVIFTAPSGVRPLDAVPRARLIRHGRRAFRRWAPADYLMLYELEAECF
jgi:SAM-dependent methyltransferase